jgi:hypothetical protein
VHFAVGRLSPAGECNYPASQAFSLLDHMLKWCCPVANRRNATPFCKGLLPQVKVLLTQERDLLVYLNGGWSAGRTIPYSIG